MARSPEEAVHDAVEAIGSTRRKKYRETVHLPIHQIDAAENPFSCLLEEDDVPEYFSDIFEESRPEWIGSTCRLDAFEVLIRDYDKVAFLVQAARLNADGSVMQTFEAIFTVAKRGEDWRLISRNPFNVTRV